MIQRYIRTIALGFVASFALACIGSSACAQQTTTTTTTPIPVPTPGTVTGTDPVPPPPPPHFAVQRSASL